MFGNISMITGKILQVVPQAAPMKMAIALSKSGTLVFMQYEQITNRPTQRPYQNLRLIPAWALERVAAVMQGRA